MNLRKLILILILFATTGVYFAQQLIAPVDSLSDADEINIIYPYIPESPLLQNQYIKCAKDIKRYIKNRFFYLYQLAACQIDTQKMV